MLNGWKAIAAYLRREERTAMRWAAERGMPVHRTPGPGRGSIYAFADEIDTWLAVDRDRVADASLAVPIVTDSAKPWLVRISPMPWRRRRWIASASIASGAVLAMAGALTLRHPARTMTPAPVFTDPGAKSLFLKATYDWNLRTRDSLARAIQEYSQAIGRDPRVPAAYVGLANSYLLLREYGSMADADAYARAEAAAKAAIALSPDEAEAHRALAFIAFWWRLDRETARREFARAISLKPDDPLTHHWFATALLANGETEAASQEIGKARDLDPTSTAVLADQGSILYFAGHRAEGLDILRTLARDQPEDVGPHRSLAEIALYEGRGDEFLREAAATAQLRGDHAAMAEIARWRSAGNSTAAIELAMLNDEKRTHAGWFGIARIAALAGRRDEAKDALARACAAHEPATVSASIDPWLSRSLNPADIAQRCGKISLLS